MSNLRVEFEEPHKIANIRLVPAGATTPQTAPASRMGEAEAVAGLCAELEKRSGSDQFSGAVLIAKHRKAVFEDAYGLADREHKTANTLDTRFRLGSMDNMFTAVAVVQLAQAGELKLRIRCATSCPTIRTPDVAAKVPTLNLLTHTGGTGDFFGPEYQAHRAELREKDYLPLFGKRTLEFAPGSKWEYSNYGFLLLGLAVEAASGQRYYDYIRKHIYNTAGMHPATHCPRVRWHRAHLATQKCGRRDTVAQYGRAAAPSDFS